DKNNPNIGYYLRFRGDTGNSYTDKPEFARGIQSTVMGAVYVSTTWFKPILFNTPFVISGRYCDGKGMLYSNSEGPLSATQPSGSRTKKTDGPSFIGANVTYGTGVVNNFNGYIAEVMLFTDPLDESDLAGIHRELTTKYAIN
ncbi:MAG TPA: hypothetical protein VHV83_07440, partial [Armatimonadota bacterium]|nr:hypothetical protein [Armatimonadota bacterium]